MCVSLRYSIVLHKSKEGYAVSCSALPRALVPGATEEEAVENIRDAIREYLAAIKQHYSLQTFAKSKSPFNDAENSRR
jgi:predicted RNase H-like HicB family nuclease